MTISHHSPLVFAHLGDLHLTDEHQQNYRDLVAITAQIEAECAGQLDFVLLPGDNADNGKPDQYALLAGALRVLSVPVHAIPGDHDMEPGSLDVFYAGLGAPGLPMSVDLKRHRLLFLDCCGNGSGGPDLRLGRTQLDWIEAELAKARLHGETPVVFMHTYPSDLRGDGEATALIQLFSQHDVALVEMGHTHYNEIAREGSTIYAATRSTGQIEEGPVGYSLTTIDNGIVSWRFKPLADSFPFVMIAAPADHRLLRGEAQKITRACDVRALVLGREAITRVECQIDSGEWTPMRRLGAGDLWDTTVPIPTAEHISITVRASTTEGVSGAHSIVAAGDPFVSPARTAHGSDKASIGAWPENGIFGTQLGPNRNGRKW